MFVSPDYESKDSLLCLIHGSGVVRAGQWARKLIINNSLDQGLNMVNIGKMGLEILIQYQRVILCSDLILLLLHMRLEIYILESDASPMTGTVSFWQMSLQLNT